MEQDSFEAFLKALRTDQDRLREDMRPYESAGYLLLRRAPTGELQDVTDQYVAKIKRDIDSIDGAIEFVMAQQGAATSLKRRSERGNRWALLQGGPEHNRELNQNRPAERREPEHQ
jgi:hypothetical protein